MRLRGGPDGHWLAYTGPGAHADGVRLVTADGAQQRVLSPPLDVRDAGYSRLEWDSARNMIAALRASGGFDVFAGLAGKKRYTKTGDVYALEWRPLR